MRLPKCKYCGSQTKVDLMEASSPWSTYDIVCESCAKSQPIFSIKRHLLIKQQMKIDKMKYKKSLNGITEQEIDNYINSKTYHIPSQTNGNEVVILYLKDWKKFDREQLRRCGLVGISNIDDLRRIVRHDLAKKKDQTIYLPVSMSDIIFKRSLK